MFRADLFAGQRVLVTGGGSGLGRMMAEKLLSLGAAVEIWGRRGPVLAEAILWLLSDAASYVAGARLPVGGGR